MPDLLTISKILIGFGLLMALLAVTVGGPDLLTLFLTIGQGSLFGGMACYGAVVVKELREEGIL